MPLMLPEMRSARVMVCAPVPQPRSSTRSIDPRPSTKSSARLVDSAEPGPSLLERLMQLDNKVEHRREFDRSWYFLSFFSAETPFLHIFTRIRAGQCCAPLSATPSFGVVPLPVDAKKSFAAENEHYAATAQPQPRTTQEASMRALRRQAAQTTRSQGQHEPRIHRPHEAEHATHHGGVDESIADEQSPPPAPEESPR